LNNQKKLRLGAQPLVTHKAECYSLLCLEGNAEEEQQRVRITAQAVLWEVL